MDGSSNPAAVGARTGRHTGIGSAARNQLAERWAALYGTNPPATVPASILRLAIAYREQEREHGALKPALRRRLLEAAESNDADSSAKHPTKLRPGTVLVREWQGAAHTVTILDKGVTYGGKLYRSLTQVADAITGSHWSGPEFFGLRSKRVVASRD